MIKDMETVILLAKGSLKKLDLTHCFPSITPLPCSVQISVVWFEKIGTQQAVMGNVQQLCEPVFKMRSGQAKRCQNKRMGKFTFIYFIIQFFNRNYP